MPLTIEENKRVKYKELDNKDILIQLNNLNLLFTQYANQYYKGKASFYMDMDVLSDVIIHVNKRIEHAKIFHNIDDSNEFRVLALYCYWIVRLHPFQMYKNKEESVPDINESFALYVYIMLCKSIFKAKGKEINLSTRYLKELKYTLRYRELNKATLILLLEPKVDYEYYK